MLWYSSYLNFSLDIVEINPRLKCSQTWLQFSSFWASVSSLCYQSILMANTCEQRLVSGKSCQLQSVKMLVVFFLLHRIIGGNPIPLR